MAPQDNPTAEPSKDESPEVADPKPAANAQDGSESEDADAIDLPIEENQFNSQPG